MRRHPWTPQAPSSYLAPIWYDTLVYQPTSLKQLIEPTWTRHVMLGSDYPFEVAEPLSQRILDQATLEDIDGVAITRRNAHHLVNPLHAQGRIFLRPSLLPAPPAEWSRPIGAHACPVPPGSSGTPRQHLPPPDIHTHGQPYRAVPNGMSWHYPARDS